ncbi:MAG: Holliday junction branch migration protein RuvA [Bacillota bacterium]
MYEYMRGKLEYISEDYAVVDINGIGYRIYSSQNSLKAIKPGNDVKMLTHLLVKEDDLILYGFTAYEELRLFKQLISVSGVGPKAAVSLLSQHKSHELAGAIISKNIGMLVKAPGIGRKIAERIILELKDKIDTDAAISVSDMTAPQEDASQVIEALMSLGYNYSEAANAVARLKDTDRPIDLLIKDALKQLSL